MRSLALSVLLGSLIAPVGIVAQSLTEHAAAAAGGTIGTVAGKPIGKALGGIFGNVDQTAAKSAATAPKAAKPVAAKPSPVELPERTEHSATVGISPAGGGVGFGGGDAGGSGGGGSVSHHAARRRRAPVEREAAEVAPIAAPIAPVVIEPVIKEPTVEEVASIKVGATASAVRAALGAPESQVSIPDDDGHMLEICQYWAKGERIGTVRLDNGRVVSVETSN